MNDPVVVPFDEVDDWIKNAISEYAPSDYIPEGNVQMDLKRIKVRGHTKKYFLILYFDIDHQDEVVFFTNDMQHRNWMLKVKLADLNKKLSSFYKEEDSSSDDSQSLS